MESATIIVPPSTGLSFILLSKYRFPVPIDFKSCRVEIAGALQEFCNRWCKRQHVESNALNSWKLNILKLLMVEFHFIATI